MEKLMNMIKFCIRSINEGNATSCHGEERFWRRSNPLTQHQEMAAAKNASQ